MTRSHFLDRTQPPDPSLPLFTIGTVSRRVGVSTPALRMWEERYGVMAPYRDENGRRLYSQAQIDDLRWIREAITNGLTAAEAHRMLETRRRAPQAVGRMEDITTAFRGWVLAEHGWLRSLCAETVEGVAGALLAYIGVHDSSPDGESWLLLSCLRSDRPDWFTGTAHQAARLRGDRLAGGEIVSIPLGSGERGLLEMAAPVMTDSRWVATVALIVGAPVENGHTAVLGMRDRVQARFAAWQAYARFEELTGLDSPAEAHSA